MRSFWRGNLTNIVKIIPESAFIYTLFDLFQKTFSKDPKKPEAHERFVSGGLSGLITRVAVYPLDTLKTRLMVAPSGTFTGVFDCARKIYTAEGIGAFYRGMVSGIAGVVPYVGLNMTIYESLKSYYADYYHSSQPPKMVALGCGVTSGAIAQFVVYPSALVMTRMQAQGLQKLKESSASKSSPSPSPSPSPSKPVEIAKNGTGLGSTIKSIFAKDGLLGFYRGIGVNYMKTLPAVGISFVVYESLKQQFNLK